MDFKEVIQKSYEEYLEILEQQNSDDFKDSINNRYAWISHCLFDITTYDDALDIEFGKTIHEVMIQIFNRTTFEYIKIQDNYKKYIIVCNLLTGYRMLEWGTSIRGAWFDYGKHIDIIDLEENINITEEFMKYLLFDFIDS